ncbi:WD repeat-containing protein on Y chromosome [Acromyrmex echinatior]|uniref:WD repeat-containing protein on Y chromosome n=1 Tax=Acromyrmex echinatior TaxID=103372 RepID=F4W6Z4_ACREC|nr:WD repeat-containing protein on Y chromosome [Acromyrmex echinatior]
MTNEQKEFRKLNEISGSVNQQIKKLTPCVHQESALNIVRVTAVRAIIFLAAREMKPDVGTLLVALDSGLIQVWTHHPAAGFLGAFSVIHTVGDCATSLATDPENQFFITGHSIGYIKVWLLSNYMLPNPPKICMPLLRLEFPFLWKDKINGVLHGGMRRPIEFEEKEIDISKEILEGEQYMLYGKEFDRLVLETYYESQLPETIYQKHLRLDNTLPYIPIYTYLSTYSLKPVEAQKILLLEQKIEPTYEFLFLFEIIEKISHRVSVEYFDIYIYIFKLFIITVKRCT